jgi:hypothetical protein
MNNKTQLDFHPDAEALSAFAELVLAEGERGQIAAHLAICERCRQVVFLAQEAAPQEELNAVSVGKVGKNRRSWFRNWWLVWAPTAAMAMGAVLAVYLHVRHTETQMEMAKATQEASPLAMTRSGADASNATEVPPAPSAAAGKDGVTPNHARATQGTQIDSPAVSVKGKVATGATEEMASSGSLGAPPPRPGSIDEFKPQPVLTARSSELQSAAVMTQEQASVNDAERSQPESQDRAAAPKAKDASPAVVPGSPAAVGFGAGIKTAKAAALSAPKASALPSGLRATSTVKGTRATVTVDETGNMFVSTDNGVHWENVARQWSGRAVTVRMQTKTPGIYEMVNDQGQSWASPDGLVWTAE